MLAFLDMPMGLSSFTSLPQDALIRLDAPRAEAMIAAIFGISPVAPAFDTRIKGTMSCLSCASSKRFR